MSKHDHERDKRQGKGKKDGSGHAGGRDGAADRRGGAKHPSRVVEQGQLRSGRLRLRLERRGTQVTQAGTRRRRGASGAQGAEARAEMTLRGQREASPGRRRPGSWQRRCSAQTLRPLPTATIAVVGHGEPLPVGVDVHADLRAVGDDHVLVQDRVAHHRTATDPHAGQQHSALDVGALHRRGRPATGPTSGRARRR